MSALQLVSTPPFQGGLSAFQLVSFLVLGSYPANALRDGFPSARSGDIFGNAQMLVVRAVESGADSLGQLVSREQPVGLTTLCLPWTHLGSIESSHGLFLGSKQLMILTPEPLFLTRRLWEAIHSLTSRLMCQEALSQIRSHTFLPPASSFSEHHERNRVAIPLTGRPSTKRNHTFSNSGR
jgi:hypothetical protein